MIWFDFPSSTLGITLKENTLRSVKNFFGGNVLILLGVILSTISVVAFFFYF